MQSPCNKRNIESYGKTFDVTLSWGALPVEAKLRALSADDGILSAKGKGR